MAVLAVPHAQQAPATQPTPTFRTGADAVVLDIVVRDKRGTPVRDLSASDVTVLEDGVERDIRSFRLVQGGTPALTVADAAAPGAVQPDPLRRITLITLVFDHLSQDARAIAREAALQFVSRELPTGQWISVCTLDQRLYMTQPFTRSTAALKQAINRATARSPGESRDRLAGRDVGMAPPGAPPADSTNTNVGGPGVDTSAVGSSVSDARVAEITALMENLVEGADIQQRGHSTLFPMMALVKAHTALEGRKAVLFFSEGFSVPPNLEDVYRGTISEANRAHVSFYTVDARGLATGRSLEASRALLERSARNSQSQQAAGASQRPVSIEDVMNSENAELALRSDTQGGLRAMAEETGGVLVANRNELGPLLERVYTDLDSYYEIAYTPKPGTLDGAFRKVEVKIARRGVVVQSRAGYFALPAVDGAPLMPYELPMLAAAGSPSPPRAFPYRVGTFTFHDTPRGRHHTLVVEVPLESLSFKEDRRANRYSVAFTVLALVKDDQGRVVERLSHSYPLEGPLDRLDALKRGNIIFKRQLWLPPGRYSLTVVARDQATERASVEHTTLDVPAGTSGVRVSSLAVIRRLDPATEQADPVEDPFRADTVRIVPSLNTPISRATNNQISAFVVIYPVATGGSPELTFEFVRDGKVFGRATPPLPEADERGRISYVATFPAQGFEPGTYELRAIARQGATHDESRAPFTIVP